MIYNPIFTYKNKIYMDYCMQHEKTQHRNNKLQFLRLT